ncbi:hypothetical protein RRG08_035447 [Elysia crispata]|uniref:Uncharacterized protein n=1 Tax=Elysia crispata TaxID=231223 RepID=A0AAE1CS58_9GAST|nr:hypothetical protein RRG08_035447 [Elysia crispata]
MCDYQSMQSLGHPRNNHYHHGQQTNPYWLNHNHQNHSPFPRPRHFYPMRQVFVQHGPFGNGGNRFLPAPLPHFPNPMHFHPHVPSPNYNNDNRRIRNHPDNDHVHEVHRFYHSGHMRVFGQDRSHRYEQGQGARPKTFNGKFKKDKNRSARKKKHQSIMSSTQLFLTPKEAASSAKEISPKPHLFSADHKPDLDFELTENNMGSDEGKTESTGDKKAQKKYRPVLINDDEIEGAVGGVEYTENSDSVGSHCDDQDIDPSVYDKNLIDEGAICDLDSMFLNQEFSGSNGDLKSFYLSDDNEDGNCDDNIVHLQTLDSFTKLDGDNSNGDKSGNGKQAGSMFQDRLGLPAISFSSLSLPCKTMSATSPQQDLISKGERVSNFQRVELEDGEDTGDFIDTDLPAQCLLSSSDEMDNESSSDLEEDPPFLPDDGCVSLKMTGPDINCNDLPIHGSNSLPEALEDIKIKTSKLQLSYSPSTKSSSQGNSLKSLMDYKRQKSQCNACGFGGHSVNSSDSDNDESHKVNIHNPLMSKARNCAPSFCSQGDFCGDGAAASQVMLEENQMQLNRSGNGNIVHISPHLPISPPGADSEMPLLSEQCFLNNGAIPAPSDVAISQGGLGPSVNNADCEPSPADACSLSAHPETSSCSSTASGGACHQQFQAFGESSACYQDGGESLASNQVELGNVALDNGQLLEGDSYSASSYNAEMNNMLNGPCCTKELTADGSSPEDPSLSHDNSDNIDMVLLPMEEEIEPVLRMGSLLFSGGGTGTSDLDPGSAGFSSPTFQLGTVPNLCEDHDGRCPIDQGHLRGAVPSKEFYELIKTVSTTDSYMRFYDKDGHDVQRERVCGSDDEQNHEDSSKAERLRVDRVMIWNEYEAYVMQFKQIAVSACGQTAVLNVLKALKIACEKSAVCKVIQGSLRKEDADIPEYLFSRAVAGTTAEELMSGIETLSGGTVGGRFFAFWPLRKVKLLQWLAYWMKRGAIPVATLNLQQGPHSVWQVPDSWHHQMVYGVSHQGLYLTNPLEIVSERSAMKQLCSDSVLMVRRQDIISRFRKTTDLGELLCHPDPRWSTMNVLGQVVNVLREFNMPSVPGYRLQVTSHVSIPACYKAGITLFMRKDKAAWATLLSAPDLPVDIQSLSPKPEIQHSVTGAGVL